MTEVKIHRITPELDRWLWRYVSPQSYYLHNRIGGVGWAMIRTKGGWRLQIDDDKKALMCILSIDFKI